MATAKVLIFGHDLCPYTSRAREDFSRRKIPFEYLNVLQNNDALQQMLKHSNGRRQIPVIVEAGKVTVGFGGS
ncbi:MAG TPA: UXX-star (seleno)protein family 1 [Candidatus Binatia bacterium]|jgi:glutaredoxin 3|nr:UXX-star (seleno)protein family 1 [Candidatus Binatia bacterium]